MIHYKEKDKNGADHKINMSSLSVVGKRMNRIDSISKVTGQSQYVNDINLPGMLYGKLLRSPYPHAKINNINTQKALKLRGVKAVATAEDMLDRKHHWMMKDQTVFARSKVLYFGQPVAGVAAIEEDIAEEALDLIEVDYQELPSVSTPDEAMKPNAPLLHEKLESYQTILPTHRKYGNVCAHLEYSRGDVDKGFKESAFVFEDEFSTQRVYHAYTETRGTIAVAESSGRIIVWQNTQTPFADREDLRDIFNLPLHKIRVISTVVGGAFGGKGNVYLAPYAVILAMKTKKPVKIINTREEDIWDGRPRHGVKIRVKTGVNKDGLILARQFKMIYDTGAYAEEGPGVSSHGVRYGMGPYNIPNLKMEAICVYTNNVVCGAFRGYGVPQPTFAGEVQMDMIAEKLGIDPLEFRLKNGLNEGDPQPVTGRRLAGVGYKETLREVGIHSEWGKGIMPKNKGKGLASMQFTSGGQTSGAIVKVNEDATAQVLTGGVDLGQGSSTVFAQIAAEVLGIPYENVSLVSADTETTPFDTGTWGDTKTHDGGNAVKRAAEDAKSQILEFASEILEANIMDLELSDGKVIVKGSPEKAIPLIDICIGRHYHKGGPIIGRGTHLLQPPPPSANAWNIPVEGECFPHGGGTVTFASQVAEVRVDVETGQVKVGRFLAAHDCGKPINPIGVEGQIEGAVAQGLGMALTEELIIKNGIPINNNLIDYKVPTVYDIGEVKAIIPKGNAPSGPFGAKGVGEPGLLPTSPAIANAIYDAIGVRIKDLPITPDKILEALEEKNKRDY